MKVQIITMVKDEDDIIENFINYYGKLFGYNNLFIIDNISNDNTYNICLKYKQSHNINLYQKNDYKKKGIYMKQIILENLNNNYDFFLPLDIDEFLVLYKDNKIHYGNKIIDYLNEVENKDNKIIGINYIYPLIEKDDYKDAVKEVKYTGKPTEPKNIKGLLFNNNLINENLTIDHGNHLWHYSKLETNLCFIHYHTRFLEQYKTKIINNYVGLGYDCSSIEKIKETINNKNLNSGNHHQLSMLKIIENNLNFPTHNVNNYDNFLYIGDIEKYI